MACEGGGLQVRDGDVDRSVHRWRRLVLLRWAGGLGEGAQQALGGVREGIGLWRGMGVGGVGGGVERVGHEVWRGRVVVRVVWHVSRHCVSNCERVLVGLQVWWVWRDG